MYVCDVNMFVDGRRRTQDGLFCAPNADDGPEDADLKEVTLDGMELKVMVEANVGMKRVWTTQVKMNETLWSGGNCGHLMTILSNRRFSGAVGFSIGK